MKSLTSIFEDVNYADRINRQLGSNQALTSIMDFQNKLDLNLTVLNANQTTLNKFWQNQFMDNKYFSHLDSIAKSFASLSQFNIPQTTIDALNSINMKNQEIFSHLKGISDWTRATQSLFHPDSLHNALCKISGEFASYATLKKQWDLIDDFEEISNQAVIINEKIIEDEGVTKASLDEIKRFMERIDLKIDKNNSDSTALFFKLLTILGFIFALLGEIRYWIPKQDFATKEEVQDVIKNRFIIIQSKSEKKKDCKTTNRQCKVMLKPSAKSLVLMNVPSNSKVIVLQGYGKWSYVSMINSGDSFPVCGWIMKKSLNSSK